MEPKYRHLPEMQESPIMKTEEEKQKAFEVCSNLVPILAQVITPHDWHAFVDRLIEAQGIVSLADPATHNKTRHHVDGMIKVGRDLAAFSTHIHTLEQLNRAAKENESEDPEAAAPEEPRPHSTEPT